MNAISWTSVVRKGILLVGLLWSILDAPSQAQDLDVPYVPTPEEVVNRMLQEADVGPGDYVIDLGSGDGRIVIAAAKNGAVGHGVDLDPQRVREARENAIEEGVDDRVLFLQEDIFETDIHQASVITMYLLTSVNQKLRPRLFEDLRPGTKVVSHSFDMGSWEPDREIQVDETTGGTHTIYYWVIPADARGSWGWSVDGSRFSMKISQQFQHISLSAQINNEDLVIRDPVLRGRRITFKAKRGNMEYLFNGRIESDTINGTVQIRREEAGRLMEWVATRK